MKHQSISKRILSMVLALAMVLALLPGNLIPTTSAATLIPSSVSKVVYVVGTGAAAAPSGATTYTTLEDAMQGLSSKPAESAVIVILGTVSSTVSYNLDGAESHTGTYYITGKYGSYSGGTIKFNKGTATNYNFGGPVVIENITLNQSQNKNLNFHASTSLTIGDGVTMAGYEKFYIMAGSYHANVANSTIKVSSGKWYALRAGNNTKNITGTATITVDGSAVISSNIAMAGNDTTTCSVANAVINVNGGNVNAIYMNAQGANMSIGNVTVNLNGGESLKGLMLSAGTVTGNVTVNMSKNFTPGSSFAMTIPALATGKVSSLHLKDFTGELPEKIAFGSFDNVVVESGAVVYNGNDVTDQNFAAYNGASLCLPNVAAQPSGATVSGEVHFNTSTVPTPPPPTTEAPVPPTTEAPVPPTTTEPTPPPATANNTVYVSGSGSDSNNGTADAPFATLGKAYSYLAANYASEGGTVVLSGNVTISADTDLSSAAITGQVTLTAQNGAKLIVSGGTSTNVNLYFGANSRITNLSVDASGSKALFLFTGTEMVLDEGITTTGVIKIFCAKKTSTVNDAVELTVNSGTYHTIFMGGNNGSTSGSVDVIFNGGEITDFVFTGPNSGSSASKLSSATNVSFTLNDGSVRVIYNVPNVNGTVKDVVVNLNGGSITKMCNVDNANAPTVRSFTVNVANGFEIPAQFGVWTGATVTNAPVLNLIGYSGTVPNGALANYKAVNFKNNSNATYAGTLSGNQSIVVESGSTLTLSGYYGANELPSGTTATGNVIYAEKPVTVTNTVYVSGSGSDSNNGTANAPFATLGKAYAYLAANYKTAGGTIVICGNVTISADTDLEAAGVTGQVTITCENSAELIVSGGSSTNVNIYFGQNTNIHNLTLDAVGSKAAFLHTGSNMTIGSGMNITGTVKVFCNKKTNAKTDTINVTINSGSYDTVFMGANVAGAEVGNVNLTLGSAVNLDLLVTGGNAGHTQALTINSSATITKIAHTPNKNTGSTGAIKLNLNGGSVATMAPYGATSNYVIPSYTINISNGVSLPSSFGVWTNCKTASGGTTVTPVTINIAENANITFNGTLPDTTCTINVKTGATLTLGGYNEGAVPANTVINASVGNANGGSATGGTVLYADSGSSGGGESADPIVIYVKNAGSDSADGLSPETAVKTLTKAYALIAANSKTAGGTIVVCGALSVSANADLRSYGITGKVTITSVYGNVDYSGTIVGEGEEEEPVETTGPIEGDDGEPIEPVEPVVEDKAVITFASGIYVYFGENTELNSLVMDGNAGTVYIYTGLKFVVSDNASSTGTLKLFCADYNGSASTGKAISVTINSGYFDSLYAGSNIAGNTVGNVTITVGGTANIRSLFLGGNKGHVGTINFTQNGGNVGKVMHTPTKSSGKTGAITVNLVRGTIGTWAPVDDTATTADAFIIPSVTINVYGTFADSISNSFGAWGNCWTSTAKTTNTPIYLNILGAADMLYANALPSGTKIKVVESGSVLTLSAYSGATDASNAGVTIDSTGAGTVKFIGGVTSDIVYVNGVSGSDAKDGTSVGNAVKTLDRAYGLLNKTNGGTIVFVGNVTQSADKTFYDTAFTGTVTLTSVDPRTGMNLGGKLIFNGAKMHFTFGINTRLEAIEVVGDAQVYLHTGKNMYVANNVTTSGSGTLTLYIGFSGEDCKNATLEMYGGSWKQILLGGHKGDITQDVTCTLGGTVNITGSVTPGSGRTNSGNITLNMNGGYVKVLYDTPRSAGTVSGTVTYNLFGGSISKMIDYTSIAAATKMSDIVVNIKPTFSIASNEFGEWTNSYLTIGKRTLNYLGYTGVAIPSIDSFQAVNLFGTDTIPSGFSQPAFSASSKVLSVYDFAGILSVDMSSFKKLFVTTSTIQADYPDVICAGKVPTTMALSVDNTDLYILPSLNIGATKASYTINLDDRVIFENTEYEASNVIVKVDFENGITDTSGKNNPISLFGELLTDPIGKIDSHTYKNYPHITVHAGNEDYINSLIDCGLVAGYGYNGDTALYIANAFGKSAKNYFTIDLSGSGLDVTRDNYTVGFWYMSQLGGTDQWSRSVHSTTAGTNNLIYNYNMGGTIFSNQNVYEPDKTVGHSGMSLYQMSHYKFIGGSAVSANGKHMDTDGNWQGNDDRWHYMAVSVDRKGSYSIYVDGELIQTSGISAYANEVWGENKLSFGADVLGQYGLNNAYIDDIVVYAGAMNLIEVQANYYEQRVGYLANLVEDRVESLGKEYDPYKAGMLATLQNTLTACENLTAVDYVELAEQYDALRVAFETFLDAPTSTARTTTLLLADIHLGAAGTDTNLKLVTKQLVDMGIDIDVLLSAGDFSDKVASSKVTAAYSTYKSIMTATYGLNDAFFFNCVGNHDVAYSNADNNYLSSMPIYKENMDAILAKVAKGATELEWMMDSSIPKTDEGYKPYSFAATLDGIHYLALNTDYMKQTGNAADYKDANGAYSIEGNKYDPIRHTMYISDNTFEWIKGWLDKWEAEGDNAPILVIAHYMFEDTIPLSFDSDIYINSNTVGRNDYQLRELLSAYKNVFYFCGHNHSTFGVIDPYKVEVTTNTYGYLEDGEVGSFWEINLPSLKANARGYRSFPHTWVMYIYDTEVVFRARDFSTQEWRTEFDWVMPLYTGEHAPVKTEPKEASCTEAGHNEYWYCDHCESYFSDEACENPIADLDAWLAENGAGHIAKLEHSYTGENGVCVNGCDKCRLGDANRDGEVNENDAVTIKHYRAGLISETDLNLEVCDLDGNGKVDAYDAYLIQIYDTGAITIFPAETITTTNTASSLAAGGLANGRLCYQMRHVVKLQVPAVAEEYTEEEDDEPKVLDASGDTIRLLMIGGSFSMDAMNWLHNIAKSAGVNMELAIIYKGGSAIAEHLANGANTASYYFYTVDAATGEMVRSRDSAGNALKYSLSYAVSQDWDYICIQEASGSSGMAAHYATDLPAMIELVRSMNSTAKLIWHMTWAYQQDVTHDSFPNYDNNQLRMYNMILNCLENNIKPEYDFDIVIPNMTAIQNVRTSYIGDTLTRDGYHMNMNYGRYITALTTFAAVTGVSVDNVSFVPDTNYIDSRMVAVAKEAVTNAINDPMVITKSSYPGNSDKETAAIYGIDLDNYVEVNWAYTANAYWKCNESTEKTIPSSAASTYNMYICSTGQFTTNKLPEGTIFIMDHGWYNRIHIWQSKTEAYTGARPAQSGVPLIKLDDILNGCNYIAWNLGYTDYRYTADRDSNLSALFDVASSHFRVYIPQNP